MKRAFTLAEILIVLTIIGVMAVMTIPSLMQNANSQQKIALFKKAFNVVSNAYATEFALKSPPTGAGDTDRDILFDNLATQLNIKYYYKISNQSKEYTHPNSNKRYADYIMVNEDGLGYMINGCKSGSITSKIAVNNVKESTTKVCSISGLTVVTFLEPTKITSANISTSDIKCDDNIDLSKIKCSRIAFFVTKDGITAGNPDCIIAGRIMSDNTTYDESKCTEENP